LLAGKASHNWRWSRVRRARGNHLHRWQARGQLRQTRRATRSSLGIAALLAVGSAEDWQAVTVDHDIAPFDLSRRGSERAHGVDPDKSVPFEVRGTRVLHHARQRRAAERSVRHGLADGGHGRTQRRADRWPSCRSQRFGRSNGRCHPWWRANTCILGFVGRRIYCPSRPLGTEGRRDPNVTKAVIWLRSRSLGRTRFAGATRNVSILFGIAIVLLCIGIIFSKALRICLWSQSVNHPS
jgi:hypothetical protein